MWHHTKGVQDIKSRRSDYMWLITKISYAEVVGQNSLEQPKPQQTFTAEQLTKFVANVVIQIAQPQVYPNPKQDALDLKSSMCQRISNAAKTILIHRFSQRPCPTPKPFTFTNTKVNPVHKPITKPSTILKSISPTNKTTNATPDQVGSSNLRP